MPTEISELMDPYKILAACMFSVTFDSVTKAQRRSAKVMYFSQLYLPAPLEIPESVTEIYSPLQLKQLQSHFKVEPYQLHLAISDYFHPRMAR